MSAEQEPKPEFQKWEYCVLHSVAMGTGSVVDFLDLSEKSGFRRAEIKGSSSLSGGIEKKYRAIAGLGEAGWELVNFESPGVQFLIFKRPKI